MPVYKDKVVYLAGPFTSNPAENRRQAGLAAQTLRRLGYAVIVPHFESILNEDALDGIGWVRHGLELLKKCDFIALFGDWERSSGTRIELNNSVHWGIPLLAIFDTEGAPLFVYSGGQRSAESWTA